MSIVSDKASMRLLLTDPYPQLLDVIAKEPVGLGDVARRMKRSRQAVHELLRRLVHAKLALEIVPPSTTNSKFRAPHFYVASAKEFRFSPEILKVARHHITLNGRERDEILRQVVLNDDRDRILHLLSSTYGRPGKTAWSFEEIQAETQMPDALLREHLKLLVGAELVLTEDRDGPQQVYLSAQANMAVHTRMKWKLEMINKYNEGFTVRRKKRIAADDPALLGIESLLGMTLSDPERVALTTAWQAADVPFVKHWELLSPSLARLPSGITWADSKTAAVAACLGRMSEEEFQLWIRGWSQTRRVLRPHLLSADHLANSETARARRPLD